LSSSRQVFLCEASYQRLLAACPDRASPERDWTHLVLDYDRAWKDFDGHAGKQEGSS
jgi:hypothetical protein